MTYAECVYGQRRNRRRAEHCISDREQKERHSRRFRGPNDAHFVVEGDNEFKERYGYRT